MKLYTKRGDDGSTGLMGGKRVSKHNPRVAAYGDVDEANAAIGLTIARCDDEQTTRVLRQIQSDLFTLGAELATPGDKPAQVVISDTHVTQLERWIDEVSADAQQLRSFILPGGSETGASLQLTRAIVRRAERSIVALAQQEEVRGLVIAYVNRLSDLLFALARRANHKSGVGDIPWPPPDTTPYDPQQQGP